MLTYRNTNIIFVLLAALLAVLALQSILSFYWFLPLLLLYSGIVFYGSYYVGSSFFMKVLCSGATDRRQIAISFDDGPADAHTAEILAILKDAQVPAVFFCIGKNIAGHEKLLQQIDSEGHIIGNHSFSHHFWFDLFSTKKMLADLQQMNTAAEKAIGKKPLLFRPPYGVTTPNMARALKQTSMKPIGWSIRSLDTVIKDDEQLLAKIIGQLQPGAIVLLHDTSASTVKMLPRFIKEVRNKGYEIVSIDKLLNLQPYA
ncbi:MAG TPA: polysaccharide deacetylase family protein [Chitinophagaceae bacterium]|nr:polysaccharide deacetylase family protein [Chitinophagaceae bacterium]